MQYIMLRIMHIIYTRHGQGQNQDREINVHLQLQTETLWMDDMKEQEIKDRGSLRKWNGAATYKGWAGIDNGIQEDLKPVIVG